MECQPTTGARLMAACKYLPFQRLYSSVRLQTSYTSVRLQTSCISASLQTSCTLVRFQTSCTSISFQTSCTPVRLQTSCISVTLQTSCGLLITRYCVYFICCIIYCSYSLVPTTNCSSYYSGIHNTLSSSLKSRGKFRCNGGLKFNTVSCRCDWSTTFICP